MEQQTEQHIVTVENRKRITATQIDAVDAFSATQIVLSYAGGQIVVSGSGLKITAFSKSSGQFTAAGTVNSVKYARKGSGFKGLFK